MINQYMGVAPSTFQVVHEFAHTTGFESFWDGKLLAFNQKFP